MEYSRYPNLVHCVSRFSDATATVNPSNPDIDSETALKALKELDTLLEHGAASDWLELAQLRRRYHTRHAANGTSSVEDVDYAPQTD